MQKAILISCGLVLILFYGVLNYSSRLSTNGHQSGDRVLNEVEVSVLNLPNPYVLDDCTLTEALDAFFTWYKTVCPPMKQTISVVVANDDPEADGKWTVDLSETGLDPFPDNTQRSEGEIKRTIDLSGIPVDDVIPRIADAFGLISRFYNGIYHIEDSEIATRGVDVGAEKKLSSSNYLTSFLTSHIVAAVVGYETTRQLARGVTIPVFSTELSSASQSACGILFKIVAPSRYADQFFWIKNTAHDKLTSPTILYNTDLLYSFRLGVEPGLFGSISKSEFFSIPARTQFSSTTWSKGVPFFKDTNDIMVVRANIEKHVLALSNEVEQSFIRLKLINKGTKEYDTEKKVHDMTIKDLKMACERREEMLMNAQRLESNQQMLDVFFPHDVAERIGSKNSSTTEKND